MGFKPLVAVAQMTRFKRKQASTRRTPPATPFNNTSFLIQLQQLRELQHCASPQTLQFDQYGSMESMIACSSSFASSASPLNHTARCSNLSIIRKECSQNANCSIRGEESSDPDGRICDIVQQCPACSDDQSLVTELKLETDPEKHEGDGMLANPNHRHFMDYFDKHARGSDDSTSTKK